MEHPFPSPVRTWRNDTYAAISPKRAELSCVGKTVIITGAGSGIGRETAIAFATAGAKRLVLIGRTASKLAETQKLLQANSGSPICLIFPADITNDKEMHQIAAEVGTWDVFILNAGHTPEPGPIARTNLSDYWKAYETNVKSVIIAALAFIPTANRAHATMLGVMAGAICFSPAGSPGLSAYLNSKIAKLKTLEFLAAENPRIFVASVHPGMVDTGIFQRSGAKPELFPMDSAILSAHFMVWLSSPEAAFLRGRFVWANWDVDELKAVASRIQESPHMAIGIAGWPVLPMYE